MCRDNNASAGVCPKKLVPPEKAEPNIILKITDTSGQAPGVTGKFKLRCQYKVPTKNSIHW